VRIRDPLEWEGAVEHRFERPRGKSAQEIGGETLTANQRLLCRPGAEGDANNAHPFARHFVQVAVADPARVAAHAD
jgi:hypothetical protein